MAQSGHIYWYSGDPALQFILNSISDRIDKLESLRGGHNVDGDFSITGSMTSGTVPLDRMLRTASASAENTGIVTVTISSSTIVTVDLGTVVTGDKIEVNALAQLVKGGTTGRTLIWVEISSGAAVVTAYYDNTILRGDDNSAHAASTEQMMTVNGTMDVTTGGTLVLKLAGSCTGSDSTVAIGRGQLKATVWRGS